MIEALEIKFVKSRLFDHQTYATLIVMFGKVNYELCQLLPKSGWKGLCCDRETINDSEHVLQASRLSIELSLSISLASNFDAIRLVFRGHF